MIVDFAGLPVGTRLDNQFPDVTFLKYEVAVGGVVADSPSGHVASFNDCPGCEFFSSGANIAFARLQRTVTLHVGLLPVAGVALQRDLRLTAYDAGGIPLGIAIATVVAGAGFTVPLVVSIVTPQIASVVLNVVNDTAQPPAIAVHDIEFDNAPGGGPDFQIRGPAGGSLGQGGPPVDLPLVISRIGGSSGDVSLSVAPLPAGVSATVLPDPAAGNSAILRLQAALGPPPAVMTIVVTGVPLSPSVGPAPRTLSIELATVPLIRVVGPADIDLRTCVQSSAAHGTVTRDYWVLRDPSYAGVLNVALEGLPADVSATVSPQPLTWPGSVTGQRVTVAVTSLAGLPVPDTTINLHLTGSFVDLSFPILLHGTCPQQNRNFVIRGQFLFTNMGVTRPFDGVQVEIFRYRSDWFDDRVYGTQTDHQGNFSAELFAAEDGDYYARLRLWSPEVQLEDACNSSVWSWDTPHHSNRGGLIDVGTWVTSRDGGAGSPRAAVWQAAHDAILDFQNLTFHDGGASGPAWGFLNIIVFRGQLTPLTWNDEIHWAHGYPTGEPWNPNRAVVHEYGHNIRDRLDGDLWHWLADDARYVYGRAHEHCRGQDEFGFALDENGFGFHEGWAEYWSNDTACCPNAVGNPAIEGSVAFHLEQLDTANNIGKGGMVRVLARGRNIIHTIGEFRIQFAQQYPGGQLPSLVAPCPGPASAPTASYQHVNVGTQRESLLAAIESYERAHDELREEQRSTQGMRHYMTRAAADECTIILERLRTQLADLDADIRRKHIPQSRWLRQRRDRAEFLDRRREIQLRALRDAMETATPEQRNALRRRIHGLEHPGVEDPSLDHLLSLPPVPGDDIAIRHDRHPDPDDTEGGSG